MMRFNLQLFAQTSIVDLLKSQGKDSSYSARKELAQKMGITNYTGTAEQNTAMVKALSGDLTTGSIMDRAKNIASLASGGKASGGGTSSGAKAQTGSSISGVDQSTLNKMNSSFNASSDVLNAQREADSYLQNVKNLGSVTDIVDQSTWDALNKQWETPQAVTDAWNYTNSLLEQLSSGRTSYTDQIKDLMGQIQNRDKFSYDVDSDVLFQQYLASSMASGKTAMQDTMGQAAALTGGYGSTYATSAANQQYNAFIQDAYSNLPEYYQMALETYQMEGEEMYNQLAMLNNADATEFQRMYDSWQANFSNAQNMYNRAYGEWQDSVNNAYNSANLQLSEHGQIFDQAYRAYAAVSDNAQQKYQNEYNKWADEVNNAFKYASMANSNYWNNAEMIQRQNEQNAEMDYKYAALKQDQAQFDMSIASKSGSGSGVDEESGLKAPTESQMKKALDAYNTGGEAAFDQYLDSLSGDIDVYAIGDYVDQYGQLPLEKRTFTKSKNTTNWLWGTDNNDIVVDQYGNEYRIDALPESLRKPLTKLKKDESYTAK